MIQMKLNGLDVQAEEGWTILDTCRFYGIEIPTLCYKEHLSPYGACRLCTVEIGEGDSTKLVSSCTYPVSDGLVVRTHTNRVQRARKMLIELHVALCPTSKVIQDLASKMGVTQVRFEPKYEDCVLCGLCVRMCKEQMDGKAIGFVDRGRNRRITSPFDIKSEECRLCGGCIWICPACQTRCDGPNPESVLCNACLMTETTCLDVYDDMQCWMGGKGECGMCVREDTIAKENTK
jgi:bidirectional [NiFe] hydrogenase diaphorase subunit